MILPHFVIPSEIPRLVIPSEEVRSLCERSSQSRDLLL